MESRVAATAPDQLDLFELDVTLLEVADPASLINMTDGGCGSTYEKSTRITGGWLSPNVSTADRAPHADALRAAMTTELHQMMAR